MHLSPAALAHKGNVESARKSFITTGLFTRNVRGDADIPKQSSWRGGEVEHPRRFSRVKPELTGRKTFDVVDLTVHNRRPGPA